MPEVKWLHLQLWETPESAQAMVLTAEATWQAAAVAYFGESSDAAMPAEQRCFLQPKPTAQAMVHAEAKTEPPEPFH